MYNKNEVQRMNKFQPLMEYFENCDRSSITLSFEEIEKIIGDSLPPSARSWPAWWANDKTHTQSAAWLDTGYKASINAAENSVTFIKT